MHKSQTHFAVAEFAPWNQQLISATARTFLGIFMRYSCKIRFLNDTAPYGSSRNQLCSVPTNGEEGDGTQRAQRGTGIMNETRNKKRSRAFHNHNILHWHASTCLCAPLQPTVTQNWIHFIHSFLHSFIHSFLGNCASVIWLPPPSPLPSVRWMDHGADVGRCVVSRRRCWMQFAR